MESNSIKIFLLKIWLDLESAVTNPSTLEDIYDFIFRKSHKDVTSSCNLTVLNKKMRAEVKVQFFVYDVAIFVETNWHFFNFN